MATIELEVSEGAKALFDNYCKRTGKSATSAADNGVVNCIHSEAMDALSRLIHKGVIPAEIVAESGEAVK